MTERKREREGGERKVERHTQKRDRARAIKGEGSGERRENHTRAQRERGRKSVRERERKEDNERESARRKRRHKKIGSTRENKMSRYGLP